MNSCFKEEITFTVPGRPVPAVRMTQKSKYIKQQAQRYLAYKDSVGWKAKEVMRTQLPFDGPMGVEIWAYLSAGKRPGDSDNIAKAILDGMNGIIYYDDTQVVDLEIHRRVGLPQRAEVKIWSADKVG